MADKLLQTDKAKHLIICLVAGCLHPLFAVGLALGKECADYTNGHWCWWDVLADAVGTIIGAVVWWLFPFWK